MKIKVKTFVNIINIYILIVYTTGLSLTERVGFDWLNKVNKLIVYIMFGISFIYILNNIYKKNRKIYFGINILCFTLLILFLALSKSREAVIQSFILIGTGLYSIYLINIYKPEEIFNLILKSQLIISIFTIIFIICYPEHGKMYYEGTLVWRGAFYHKNLLAANMAFGAIISITCYNIKENRNYNLMAIVNGIISLFILYKTESVTSILIVIISFVLYKIYFRFKFKINPVYILVFAHGLIYYIIANQEKYNAIFMKLFNRNLTLTGRTSIWEPSLDLIINNPWTGYGYNSIWSDESVVGRYIRNRVLFYATGSHNGILEWALQIGVILTIILIINFMIVGRKSIKIISENIYTFKFAIQYIVYILIYYITEQSTNPLSYQVCMLFILINLVNKVYKNKLISKFNT